MDVTLRLLRLLHVRDGAVVRMSAARLGAVPLLVILLAGCAAGAAPTNGGAGTPASNLPGAASTSPAETSANAGGVKRGATGAIDACQLLTSAQIEGAIGTPVTEATNYADIECRWTVKPLAAFPGSQDPWVDVQFFGNDLPMKHIEADPGTKGVVAIDALGDRAFRTNVNRQMWVQHGSDAFVVRSRFRGPNDDTDKSRDAAEALELLMARLVLAQL